MPSLAQQPVHNDTRQALEGMMTTDALDSVSRYVETRGTLSRDLNDLLTATQRVLQIIHGDGGFTAGGFPTLLAELPRAHAAVCMALTADGGAIR